MTFATNCWEQDWEILLKTTFLKNKIQRNQYDFSKKILIINNVKDRAEVEKHSIQMIDKGVLTDYFFVEDYINDTLESFELTKGALGRGYNYSNHELVSVYLCETDYLLYFTSDTWLDRKIYWIPPALEELENNDKYKVATLVWNRKYDEAKSESSLELKDFYVGYGFSDQCFLVRIGDFKAPIYNEQNPFSERYPKHGGETFEKRVDSWMRNHNYLRLTFKHGSYLHEDFPANSFLKKIQIKMGRYDK